MFEYFEFKKMLSVGLIKVLYFLGMCLLTFVGGRMLFGVQTQGDMQDGAYGLGILIFGNLAWRLICEWIIIAFSIHERLANIETELKRRPLTSISPSEKSSRSSLVVGSLRNQK